MLNKCQHDEGPSGLEPELRESKSLVLPLHHEPNICYVDFLAISVATKKFSWLEFLIQALRRNQSKLASVGSRLSSGISIVLVSFKNFSLSSFVNTAPFLLIKWHSLFQYTTYVLLFSILRPNSNYGRNNHHHIQPQEESHLHQGQS